MILFPSRFVELGSLDAERLTARAKVHLPETLLEETKLKLKHARIDDGMGDVEWNDLEIGHLRFREVVEYWRDTYDWRKFEAHLNTFNHFKTRIPVTGFDLLDVHFLHHRSPRPDAIPLIFVHGWYAVSVLSFTDITNDLPIGLALFSKQSD